MSERAGEDPPPEWSTDERDAFFTTTLQQTHRMVNAVEGVRLQLMLAGLEAMLLEEQVVGGVPVRMDDPVIVAFHQHQADELRTTRFDVERRLEGARTLRDRLPKTWAALLEGAASEVAVQAAAGEAVGLNREHDAAFDAKAVGLVVEERPAVIRRELAKYRAELDPDAAAERHERATNRRTVRARATEDGQGVLEVHSTATDIAAAYDRIRAHAVAAHGRDGECRTLGNLMVDAVVDAILTGRMRGASEGGPSYPMERLGESDDPTRKLIDATILVTVPADTATGASDQPGSVAGMGAIDAETARIIVKHTRTWTRVSIDPVDDAVLGIDSTERYIPAGLKKLLHLRQPTCGCGCGLPAHRADIDHIQRYEHDGRTRHDNLQILCRRSHIAKDAGFATTTRLPDGRIRTKNKWGGTRDAKPAVHVRRAPWPDEPPF